MVYSADNLISRAGLIIMLEADPREVGGKFAAHRVANRCVGGQRWCMLGKDLLAPEVSLGNLFDRSESEKAPAIEIDHK